MSPSTSDTQTVASNPDITLRTYEAVVRRYFHEDLTIHVKATSRREARAALRHEFLQDENTQEVVDYGEVTPAVQERTIVSIRSLSTNQRGERDAPNNERDFDYDR